MNKNVTKNLVLTAVLLLFSSAMAMAQYYDIGSEKPSVKWEKIKSPHFEIIYPQDRKTGDPDSGIGALAAGYLKKVEAAYGIHSDSVRYTYGLPKRFPLVLHPFNAESNGVTVWGPRQIDFFSQPPVDIISTEPWDLSLATHEGRHAWQIAHFNRGFFKVLYWGFGDQAIGAASGIYPSKWFLEGDAVVAETQMSNGGRGRSGFFLCEIIKCIVPEGEDTGNYFYGKNRSWDRWRFGSVKAYSPNPYSTGYMINAMARHKSGDVDLAHKILNYEPLHFMSANVVASAFKKYSGSTHREYVKDSLLQQFLELNSNDAVEDILPGELAESMLENPVARTGFKRGYYTEYKHITAVGKDSVVAVVEGYGNPGLLVLISKNPVDGSWKEKVLRPIEADVERLSFHDGRIYWSECDTDPRWGQHADYAICGYNLKTNKSFDRKYPGSVHLPTGFEDNTDLYYLEYDLEEGSLYSYIGSCLSSWMFGEVPNGWEAGPDARVKGQITSYALNRSVKPDKYYRSDIEIFFTCLDENGIRLVRKRDHADPQQQYRDILPPSYHIIKDLSVYNGEIYFITDRFGLPTLCRLNPETGEMTLACSSPDVSSYSIAEDGSLYIIKEVGDKGELPFKEKLVSIPVTPEMEFNYPLAEELSRQYNDKYGKRVEEYVAETEKEGDYYRPEPYSKTAHLFKFHSWMPTYAEFSGETSGDYDNFYEESKLGVTAYSQNTLGTMRASAGYSFENRDGHGGLTKKLHGGHLTLTYSGWYPMIEGTVHLNDRIMLNSKRFSIRTGAAMYIPWEWDGGGWNYGVTPAVGWSFRNDQTYMESTSSSVAFRQFDQHKLTFQIGGYKMLSIARAQVYPRWGIGGRLAASLSPDKTKNFGSLYSAYAYGYLPGLTFNQGLRLSAGYQRQNVEGKKFWLDNHLDLPRGFTEDFYGRNYVRATADYAIPIYLGDVSLGPVAYLKQLQVIPFIDYSRVDFYRRTGGLMGFYTGAHYQWESRFSYGADVMLHGHFLRIGFPMYIGVRYARTNKPCDYGNATPTTYVGKGNRNYVTLLLGVNFY